MAEALNVYDVQVEEFVNRRGNRCRNEVAEPVTRMGGLRRRSERLVFVLDSKNRHSRSRNFIKLLH